MLPYTLLLSAPSRTHVGFPLTAVTGVDSPLMIEFVDGIRSHACERIGASYPQAATCAPSSDPGQDQLTSGQLGSVYGRIGMN